MPYNPNNPPKRVATTVRAITLNVSGIVAVTCSLRQIQKAWCNYQGASTSGYPVTRVVNTSGSVANVGFSVDNVIGYSGTMYSGGYLTVWAEGQ